ncbi:hypothetical protein L218DRAFT_948092 [Marasmius fiardii PR-910]|nr:hypothetical protein L218DRAFT_948092 [Marasmius fiardii PR-910]
MSYWKTPAPSSTSSALYPSSIASEGHQPPPTGGRKRKARPPIYPIEPSDFRSYLNENPEVYSPYPPQMERIVPWIYTLPTSSGEYLSASIPPTPTRSPFDTSSNLSSTSTTHNDIRGNLPSSFPPPGHEIRQPKALHPARTQLPVSLSVIQSRSDDPTTPQHTPESRIPVGDDNNSTRLSQRFRVPYRQKICDPSLERYMRDYVGHFITGLERLGDSLASVDHTVFGNQKVGGSWVDYASELQLSRVRFKIEVVDFTRGIAPIIAFQLQPSIQRGRKDTTVIIYLTEVQESAARAVHYSIYESPISTLGTKNEAILGVLSMMLWPFLPVSVTASTIQQLLSDSEVSNRR